MNEDDSFENRQLTTHDENSSENEESLVFVESCDQSTIVMKELSTEDMKPQSVDPKLKSNISTRPTKKSHIEKSF